MKRRVLAVSSLVVLLLVYVVCPFRLGIVCGASMEPTFHNGQAILVDRGYYRQHPVAHGDVILLRQDGRTLIKRVFALGGDSFPVLVYPDDAGVSRYIIDETDIPRLIRAFRRIQAGQHLARVTVPSGCMYVLGDNTSASIDSRDFGAVPLTDIIGRVDEQNVWGPMTRTLALVNPSLAHPSARTRPPAAFPHPTFTPAAMPRTADRGREQGL
jgi:signal peptidase I